MPLKNSILHNKTLILSLLIFITVFFVYTLTLNPAFHANDSPETTACSYTLGIQHPPGYPLATLLGKISTFVPVGNAGFRVNMQAAFFGAMTSVILFIIMLNVFGSRRGSMEYATAVITAMVFAFSPTIWSESLSSKGGIYTLNAFMLSVSVLSAIVWQKTRDFRYFYMLSFVFGVAMSNHWESMAVTVPAFALFIIMVFAKDSYYKKISWQRVVTVLVLFTLGLLIYYYMIIRARGNAVLNWADPSTFTRLKEVFLREQYSGMEKARSLEVVYRQVKRIGMLLYNEFTAAGLVVFTAGIMGFIKKGRKEIMALFSTVIITVLAALALYFNLKIEMIWIMDVFMIPVYISMAAIMGFGIYYINSELKTQNTKLKIVLVVIIASVLPVYLLFSNYSKVNQSRYYYAYDYGMNLVKSIEPGSLALLEGDFNVMPQMYFKYVDKRADFIPLTTLFLSRDWGIEQMNLNFPEIKFQEGPKGNFTAQLNNVIAMNYKERDIYTSVFRKALQEFYPQAEPMLVPSGVAMKFSFNKMETLNDDVVRLQTLSYRNVFYNKLHMNNTTEFCVSNYASALMETGKMFGVFGMPEKAVYYMKRAVEMATPPTKAESYTHLGIQYSALEDFEASINAYKEALKIKPEMIEARSNLTGVYNTLKMYDEAIKEGEKAVAIDPDFSEAYNNLAIAYYYKGDKKRAVQLLEKSVKLNPGNEKSKQNLDIIKGEIR